MSDPTKSAGKTQLEDPPPEARPALGYSDLAWWAEKADGAEGKDLVLAFIEAEKTVVLETAIEAQESGHRTILKGIKVPKGPPSKKQPVEEILLRVKGKSEPISAIVNELVCDSVFTTPSAIRKFVILYYETHRLLDEAQWKKLRKIMNDPNVPALGHVHPSAYGAVGTGSDLWFLKPKTVGTEIVGEWVSLDQYELSEEPEQP
jgi:hypothetical protein